MFSFPTPSFQSGLLATALSVAAVAPALAAGGTWSFINHPPAFAPASTLLLTDGTVIAQDLGSTGAGSPHWWKLTPDSSGSYLNGTWSQLADMPSGYSPLYYASAVLADGRVIINGGEYNGSGSGVWTTKGALYNPLTNSWVSVTPPTGWTTIGDAQSTLLKNGTYMLADCCTKNEALLDLATMAWTSTGTGKADINDEEAWTLLPSGQVLTVDAENGKNTEIYTKGKWASAGVTPNPLADTASAEIGPQILRPNGTVWVVGATGFTAVYTIKTKAWSAGPTFPKVANVELDSADGPGVLLPSGNVLAAASPGVFKPGLHFFEFDGAALTEVANISGAAAMSSFEVRLLLLPNGQVLETNGSSNVEIYTPTGTAKAAWKPKIGSFPATVTRGSTYTLSGTKLNGMSQAVGYGDDYQAATNYPLVRLTNTASGHVFYARTANHSLMAVASPAVVTTQVTIPAGMETGATTLVAVANGIASVPVSVTVN